MTPRFAELVARWEPAMRARGYSPETVHTFLQNLRQYARFLEERSIADPLRVTPAVLTDFRAYVVELPTPRGLPRRPATVNAILAAVKSFYRILCDADLIPYDPTRKLSGVRQPSRLPPPVLTPDEMGKLLDAIDPSTPAGGRDRALYELMYSTGARVGELAGMEVGDVDLGERYCRIRKGKGGKQRVVPFGPPAASHLENYLRWLRPAFVRGQGSRALFLSTHCGVPLRKEAMRKRLARYLRAAGIEKKVTPHGLRHACATHLLERHADLRHIQELLGHASVGTTQIYTHVDVQHLKETLARCHPRERPPAEPPTEV